MFTFPRSIQGKCFAFELHMPEWSIHRVLRIYSLAEKTKSAVIMFNDLMDEYEQILQLFEYEFFEAKLPQEDERLEYILFQVEQRLNALYNLIPSREATYNRFYGDSSSSWEGLKHKNKVRSFKELIGLTEDVSPEEIRRQCRRILKKLHPDQRGSAYLFDWVKQAYDAFKSSGK
jgi:hypothetical protein